MARRISVAHARDRPGGIGAEAVGQAHEAIQARFHGVVETLAFLADTGFSVIGVDRSSEAIARTGASVPDGVFHVGDIRSAVPDVGAPCINYGAIEFPEIEPSSHRVGSRTKRFFDERFSDVPFEHGWNVRFKASGTVHRDGAFKVIRKLTLEKRPDPESRAMRL